MTAFSTRCCRRLDLLGALLALWLAATPRSPAQPQGIDVKKSPPSSSRTTPTSSTRSSTSRSRRTLEEVLNKGVPLYFGLEFELIRPRWYWFNDRVVHLQQEYRLSYNALTRQYRLGVGNLHQNFGSLAEALEVMSRVRRRQEVEPGTLRKDTTYLAALRFRLDTSQLPAVPAECPGRAMRYIGSDWYRWTTTP